MITSSEGVNFVKIFEGYSATPYKDSAGKPTIGYGHLIRPGQVYGAISNSQATAMLTKDLGYAEYAVNHHVTRALTQYEFDALVSWVYNLGAEAFRTSTLLADINRGVGEIGIYPQFLKWCHQTVHGQLQYVEGLYYRRLAEATLYGKGSYPLAMEVYTKR